MKDKGTSYRGASEEKVDEKTAAVHDSKASLAGLPDLGFAIYLGLNCLAWWLLWRQLTSTALGPASPVTMGLLLSAGPVLLAQLMANITERSRRSILYPFHKVS